jgi:hypothetical protein
MAGLGGGEREGDEGLGVRQTRRGFLRVAAGGAWLAVLALAGCEPNRSVRAMAAPATAGPTRVYRSRPDLRPPPVEVTTPARNTAPGYLFAASKNGPGEEYPAQDGPMILDNEGQPMWLRPVRAEERDTMDFKAQSYRGKPVLTWWEGVHGGWGDGEYVIFDDSYKEIARFGAGKGLPGDHHEFLISGRDTALVTIYAETPMDLSPYGGPEDGRVMDGVAQEIDIESGEVLFEWRSLDHVGPEESYSAPASDLEEAYDYFHINSIEEDGEDHLLISARRTSAVYKVDRRTGEVAWRLGGKRSDFEMGEGAVFAFQHDARRQPDGTITLFDNRGADMDDQSRGIRLKLDEEAMTATLVQEFTHPEEPFATYQGNVQVLLNGNVFVGWGSAPYLTEHDADGNLLFDAGFPPEVESYRAFRSPWSCRPEGAPDLAGESGPQGRVTLYVSWNGATEVASWEVLVGPDLDELEAVGEAPRMGFETAITFNTEEPYVAVRAKDRSGRALGAPRAMRR